MRTTIIVQARMASTRLPGKILRTVMGKSLLAYQLERLQQVTASDELVVATTVKPQDDEVVTACEELGVKTFRGSDKDVLSRYYEAARADGADAVVRITSDCPLMDPAVVDGVISAYTRAESGLDFVANTLVRTYPRGLDCEVFSYDALKQAHQEATEPADREHVTRFFYRQPERFRLRNVSYPTDQSAHRWTVDTPEDLELIRRMLEDLYPANPSFTLENCLELISRHPEWSDINRNIVQKG